MPYSPTLAAQPAATPTPPAPTALGFPGGAQPPQDQQQMRMDWRNALNSWQDQRPTHQSMFPDFTGPPTPDMRGQFQQARTDWQNAMPQMPASLAALMPPQMQGQQQQGWRVGPPQSPQQPSPMAVPPMSAPVI